MPLHYCKFCQEYHEKKENKDCKIKTLEFNAEVLYLALKRLYKEYDIPEINKLLSTVEYSKTIQSQSEYALIKGKKLLDIIN